MEKIIASSEELFQKAGKIISNKITELLKCQDKVVLGFVGGRSIPGIANTLKKETIDWSKVHIFLVDNGFQSSDDPKSNSYVIKEKLVDYIPEVNFHPFEFEGNIDASLENYKDELSKFDFKYDIIVISSGEDGHVAALYPDHESIKDESKYFIKVQNSPKPPAIKMASSKKLLKTAKIGLIFFLEEAKRDALINFEDDKFDIISSPAKIVNELEEAYVLTDLK